MMRDWTFYREDLSDAMSKMVNVHAQQLVKRLDGFPLALATAGAFLHKDKSTWTFERYLQEYDQRWDLDQGRLSQLSEYQDRTLYTTWHLSYRHLEQQDVAAAQLLKLLAYFDHQALWYELFQAGVRNDLPEWLQTINEDLVHLDDQALWYEIFRAGVRNDLPEWLTTIASDSTKFEITARVLVEYCFLEVQTTTQSWSLHTCVHDWSLADLNITVEPWAYRYALDCVAHLMDGELKEPLTNMRFSRLAAHAARLMSVRFRELRQELPESRLRDAHDIARLLEAQDRFSLATLMYESTLAGKERALGPEHVSTLETIFSLGCLYRVRGMLDKAEEMLERTLTLSTKTRGPEHILTLNTINDLGMLYMDRGKLDRADEMSQQALAGYEDLLGREHIWTLQTVNNIGINYSARNMLHEAWEMYERALAGYMRTVGRNHMSTLHTVNNLAVLYQDQGLDDQAAEMFIWALTVYTATVGESHTSTLQIFSNLGSLYDRQNRLDEAEEMYEQALIGKEKAFGPEHSATLSARWSLGLLYQRRGKLSQAEEMLERALKGYQASLGVDHQYTRNVAGCLDRVQKLRQNHQTTTPSTV